MTRIALRRVWELLAADPEALARRVLRKLGSQQRRRAVVFVPPVYTDSDEFVETLSRLSSGPVFDFRARSADPPRRKFEEFRAARAVAGRPPILVTVDRFAEGVSVDDIDAIVMLRATLSPRVAIQALGRGLRRFKGKDHCLVLDAVLFEERVKMFERSGTMSADVHDVARGSSASRKPPSRSTTALTSIERAILRDAALKQIRSRLVRDGHRPVPLSKKLHDVVLAVLRGDTIAEPFSAADVASAIRSPAVRTHLANSERITEARVREAIQGLRLPGARARAGQAAPEPVLSERDELQARLEAELSKRFRNLELRWGENGKNQRCLFGPRNFQIARVYNDHSSSLRVNVRKAARNDSQTIKVEGAGDFREVVEAVDEAACWLGWVE